jgi:hypothetical protein
MQSDSESRVPQPSQRDLWGLPKIKALKVERVRYRKARKHVVKGKVVELNQGVEIIVQTDGEIPMRALSPALYVGSTEIAENERIDPTSYRFFALDEEALKAGAPITLGWVGHPAPKSRSKFRYQPPRDSGLEPVTGVEIQSSERVAEAIRKEIVAVTEPPGGVQTPQNVLGSPLLWATVATLAVSAVPSLLDSLKKYVSRKQVKKLRIGEWEVDDPTPEKIDEYLATR